MGAKDRSSGFRKEREVRQAETQAFNSVEDRGVFWRKQLAKEVAKNRYHI